jgi:hypothetical protein
MEAAGKRQRRFPDKYRSSDDTETLSEAHRDQQHSKPGRRPPSARTQQPAADIQDSSEESSEEPEESDEDDADSYEDDQETCSSVDSEQDDDADISDGDDTAAVGQHDLCR